MKCNDRMCGADDCLNCHPEGYSEECSECEGTGKIDLSNCCGVKFNTDIMICPSCKEHCDRDDCGECNGTGKINSIASKKEARAEWEEMKAEKKRLDSLLYEPRDRESFIDKNEQ